MRICEAILAIGLDGGVRFVPSIEADPTAEAAASGSAGSRPAPATPSSTPSSCAPQGDNA